MNTIAKSEGQKESLTVAEATRRLGGHEGYTYALLRAGKLIAHKDAGRWRISAGSVAAYLSKRAARETAAQIPAA